MKKNKKIKLRLGLLILIVGIFVSVGCLGRAYAANYYEGVNISELAKKTNAYTTRNVEASGYITYIVENAGTKMVVSNGYNQVGVDYNGTSSNLKGDYVTVRGRVIGETNEYQISGVQVKLPYIYADYISGGYSNRSTVTTKNKSSSYILSVSNKRKLTYTDIKGFSKEKLALARNEIYARHGYVFKNATYKTYFSSKSWYKANSKFKESNLSTIEKYNATFIKKYENI